MHPKTAHDVLTKYWDGNLPVDPSQLAERMGIRVVPDPSFSHSGHYKFNDGRPEIIYNSREYLPRQRFTLAHELGHHIHGDVDAPRDNNDVFSARNSSPIEIAANRFAAQLLMPAGVVRYFVLEEKIGDIDQLAALFGVSTAAMRYRLINLGLI